MAISSGNIELEEVLEWENLYGLELRFSSERLVES